MEIKLCVIITSEYYREAEKTEKEEHKKGGD